MADPKMQPCPKCGGTIKIFPSYGGSDGNLTAYIAECGCGVTVDSLSNDGTRRGAIRDWNRWAKAEKAKQAAAGSAALPPPPPDPAWKPEPPCWLVERRKEGRTTGYLGHANGSYEWMPTPDKATRFVRREDANGVAECIETEDVIVAEHIWG